MKWRTTVIATLVFVTTSSTVYARRPAADQSQALQNQSEQATEDSQKDQGPTLQETTDWLKRKIRSVGFKTKGIYRGWTAYDVAPVNFDGCSLTWRSKGAAGEVSFALTDLDPQSIELEEGMIFVEGVTGPATGVHVKLRTVNGTGSIHESRGGSNREVHNNVIFPFEDEEIANRVAKAFKHAIMLCKEKEPF